MDSNIIKFQNYSCLNHESEIHEYHFRTFKKSILQSNSDNIPKQIIWSKWMTSRTERPLVSVIIPTKDRPDMLHEAVASVLNQSYPYIEAVVINDAGFDVQSQLMSMKNSSKISYINLFQNSERSIARNIGIEKSNGDYIAYLDDDDIFYPNHIETLLMQLMTKDYKVAYSDSIMAQQSIQNGSYITYKKICYYSHDFNFEKLLINNYIPILCLMHEKKCIEKSGYFDTKISTHEDWDLWIRLAKNYNFLHIKEITSEYRMRNDNTNTTSSKFPKFLETYKYIYNKYSISSSVTDFISLQRKKNLFAINLKTYDFICNIISEINKGTNYKSTQQTDNLLKQCGANESQIISATIYLQGIAETDTSLQRQLLLRAIKFDHENYLAWLALCKNYIEDTQFELVEKTLRTLIDANPLDLTLYDSLINIAKILNKKDLQNKIEHQKEIMHHILNDIL